jgi:hypothetical protein
LRIQSLRAVVVARIGIVAGIGVLAELRFLALRLLGIDYCIERAG